MVFDKIWNKSMIANLTKIVKSLYMNNNEGIQQIL